MCCSSSPSICPPSVDMEADSMVGLPPPTPPTLKAAVLARQKQKQLPYTLESQSKKRKLLHTAIQKKKRKKLTSSTTSSPVGIVDIVPRKEMYISSIEPCTDKTLTFLQKARQQNLPIRAGKWKQEEEEYLRKLVYLYRLGLLDQVEEGTSMRSWLAKMLNCCPMRISKKQTAGAKFKGKAKFHKDFERIENMTQQQYERNCKELYFLRARLLRVYVIEKLNKNKRQIMRKSELDEWFSIVLQGVPLPRILKGPKIIENEKSTPPFVGTIQRLLQVTSCHELSQKIADQVRDDDEFEDEIDMEQCKMKDTDDFFKRNLKFEVDSPTKYEDINNWSHENNESCFLSERKNTTQPSTQDSRASSPVSLSCSERLTYTDEEADDDLQKAMDLCAEDSEAYNGHYGINSNSQQSSSDSFVKGSYMSPLQFDDEMSDDMEDEFVVDDSNSPFKIVVDFGVPSMHSTQAINPEWTQSSVFGDFYWTPTPTPTPTPAVQSHFSCTVNNNSKNHYLYLDRPIRSVI